MLYEAHSDGKCTACPQPVKRGDRICWIKGWTGVQHEACSDEGRRRIQAIKESYASHSNFEVLAPEGLSYLPFQKAGIQFALSRPEGIGTIFGDEMGLGKTLQAIGVINGSPKTKNVLVVCPASLKVNWKIEAEKWLVRKNEVQISTDPLWQISLETNPDILHVQVINYEEFKKAIRPSSFYDIVIYDEAQYIKNPESIRGQYARRLARRCHRVLCLSGTPIPNHVIDIFPLLQCCDPNTWDPAGYSGGKPVPVGFGGGLRSFELRYCNARLIKFGKSPFAKTIWDNSGSSNLSELHDRLRSTIMVRRLKRDVLPELPDKRRQILTVPCDSPEARRAVDGERRAWLKSSIVLGNFDQAIEDLARARGLNFEELSAERKAVGVAKVDLVVEYIERTMNEGLEDGSKILLFAHHDEVISALVRRLEAYQPAIIRGYTSLEDRASAVKRFQEDTECRLFVGSIGAAGVGLTLTASSHVVFAEESWSHKDISQAEDRAHRIGQKRSVLVTHIVFDGSLDANMMKKVVAKQEAADRALDGGVP